MDIIDIEILDDGSIKVTTDQIGEVHHLSAENLLKFIGEQMGGTVERTKRKEGFHHVHGKHTHHHHH